MDRRLADDAHRILSDDIKCCQDTISLVLSKGLEESLSGIVGRVSRRLLVFELDLAADTSDLV